MRTKGDEHLRFRSCATSTTNRSQKLCRYGSMGEKEGQLKPLNTEGRSRRTQNNVKMRHILFLFVAVVCCVIILMSGTIKATKHTFTTRHDRRLFVGPIGPTPFGVLQNGVYNISVLDYHLVATNQYEEKKLLQQMKENQKRKKKQQQKKDGNNYDNVDSYKQEDDNSNNGKEAWQIDYKPQIPSNKKIEFEAAFVLAKFDTYAEYIRYTEGMLDEANLMMDDNCSFELWNKPPPGIIKPINKDSGNKFRSHNVEEPGRDNRDRNAIVLHAFGRDTYSQPSLIHTFHLPEEEGEYYLFYQICMVPQYAGQYVLNEKERTKEVLEIMEHYKIESSFELDIEMYNQLGSTKAKSYLAAGDLPLPKLYLVWTLMYCALSVIWIRYIHNPSSSSRTTISSGVASNGMSETPTRSYTHHIHYIMFVLLLLKTASLFAESIRYHYIRGYGHTTFWSTVYYGFVFLKTTTLFTTMLLIGSGWSFLKPFLSYREKQILWIVLGLQVSTNLVVMIVSSEDRGEQTYEDWLALLHLIDIVCCAIILFPIVWQVHTLEQQTQAFASKTSGVSRRRRRRRRKSRNKEVGNIGGEIIYSSSSNDEDDLYDDDDEEEEYDDFSDGYYDEDEGESGLNNNVNGQVVPVNEEHKSLMANNNSTTATPMPQHFPTSGGDHNGRPLSPRQLDDLEHLSSDEIRSKYILLKKLKLFRTFYMIVVAYIYMTRIVVFMLQEHLSFRHTWMQSFVEEFATLLFYIWVGYKFRPRANNPLFQHVQAMSPEEDVQLFLPENSGNDNDAASLFDSDRNHDEGLAMAAAATNSGSTNTGILHKRTKNVTEGKEGPELELT